MKLIISMFMLLLSMQAFAGRVCVEHRGLYLANIHFDVFDVGGVRIDGYSHYQMHVDAKECFSYNSEFGKSLLIRVESVPLLTPSVLACEVTAKKGGEFGANIVIVAHGVVLDPKCAIYSTGDQEPN